MGSLSSTSERLDGFLRLVVPYSILAIMMLFNVISLPYPFTGALKPPLFLIAVYYWCIYRPGLMPAWFVFLAGLLLDFLGGLPLGLHALVFVLARWVIMDQRRFLMSQSFIVVWLGFCFLLAASYGIQWFIFGLANDAWLPLRPFLFSFGVGSMLFPIVSLILHLGIKILPMPAQEADVANFSVGSRKKRR